ncbi:Sucrase/ferredoxin-like-domain-containing protein [Abortiporus biennis]|nr:Sucrase/ferredoxin-like-domain-containing protein [Abortiporus biennis]
MSAIFLCARRRLYSGVNSRLPPRRLISSSNSPQGNPLVLAGTVPYHESYILLHTRQSPQTYPSKVPSKLQRTLQLLATQWGGIVNFSWSPEQPVHESTQDSWEQKDREEIYHLTAFSRYKGCLEIPEVSMDNLEAVCEQLQLHAAQSESTNTTQKLSKDVIHIYVCIHGNRDCRCGETGGQVFDTLRREVKARGLTEQVKVAGVGHVGGHKYAGNILVYPWGDWLAHIADRDVESTLDKILKMDPLLLPDPTTPPLWASHWRGRMGLDKESQLAMISASPSIGHTM